MFAVFSRSGQIFSGTLEDLGQVEPIAALARSRRSAASTALNAKPVALAQGHDALHRDALAAYSQAQPPAAQRHPLTRVADIMSKRVLSVSEAMTLEAAWEALDLHALGQAPVLDPEGNLVGLLLRSDLMAPESLPGAQAHPLVWKAHLLQRVADTMLTPVPAVAPETDIRRLAQVLLDTGLPGLPVVDDDGRLVGFAGRTDILRAVIADPPLDLWT
jgi:CBS domain-containing protein